MSLAYRISGNNRERKWRLFLKTFPPRVSAHVLDVGFSNGEYSPTDNLIEKKYPYPAMVTALGIEEPTLFKSKYPDVSVVLYDGKKFPFTHQQFDIVWSNAVIEHVGNRERQTLFLKEIARVGKAAYITTPNRWFPFEVHTRVPLLHWFLPKEWFDRFLRFIGKGWAAGEYMNLFSEAELRACLRDAGISSYTIVRNRFFGWTIDFVVIIGAPNHTSQSE